MIDYYEQQVTSSIPLLQDNQEQNFLSLENLPTALARYRGSQTSVEGI